MAGEHFYDGFLRNYKKEEAKDIIEGLLKRMKDGEALTPAQFEQAFSAYIPEPATR